METFTYTPGTTPLLVSIPHSGTHVPKAIAQRMHKNAQSLPDTDWHVDTLYAFASELGAHILKANYSRYVIDLNRAPTGDSLYPGQFTTGLCPTTLFTAEPLYLPGQEPDKDDINYRLLEYWHPYHTALRNCLHTIRTQHGKAILYDAHSICSVVPSLFNGTLPDLNIGTNDGTACDDALLHAIVALANNSDYSTVVNQRFKGGYITRHYGTPAEDIHAIQMELTWRNYLAEEAPPYAFDEPKAMRLQLRALRPILAHLAEL